MGSCRHQRTFGYSSSFPTTSKPMMEANQSLQASLCDLKRREDQLKDLQHPELLAAGDHIGILKRLASAPPWLLSRTSPRPWPCALSWDRAHDQSCWRRTSRQLLRERIRMGGTPPAHGARPQLRPTATVLCTLHCHVTTSNHPLIESPSPSDYYHRRCCCHNNNCAPSKHHG